MGLKGKTVKATIRPILIISLAFWGGWLGLPPAASQGSTALKEWTVLIYLNGDSMSGREDVSIAAFNQMEAVGSGPNLNIVVQWDRSPTADLLDAVPTAPDPAQNWDTVRRYLVLKDPNEYVDPQTGTRNPQGDLIFSPSLSDLGELNMGSPDTLVDFVQWGLRRFPAQRYFLVLWDGGNGWKPRSRGLLYDATSAGTSLTGSFLSNLDLQQALNRIRQINGGRPMDLLGLDGAAMGSLEVLYQLRNVARYVLTSSILVPATGRFPYDLFLGEMAARPSQSSEKFLQLFVKAYTASYQPAAGATGPSVSLSGFDAERSSPLAASLSELAQLLTENLNKWASAILVARGQTLDHPFWTALGSTVPETGADNIDLFDLALKLQKNIDDPELERLTEAIMEGVGGAAGVVVTLDKLTGTAAGEPNLQNLHGLMLYFPASGSSYDPSYSQVVDLSRDGQWDEFLTAYFNLFQDHQGPRVFISYPSNGSTIQNTRPTILATLTDVGGGRVDPSTIELVLDSKLISREEWTFDVATGRLQYQPPTALAATTHTIKLTAKDLAGNQSAAAFVSFRIAPQVLPRGIQMVSIPLQSSTDDPRTVFGAQDFTLVRWVPTDTGSNKYHYYPDAYASLIPPDAQGATPTVSQPPAGLGYWIRLPNDTPALIGAGNIVQAPNGYVVRLRKGPGNESGWNLLGNPFNEPVGWSSVMFQREGRRLTLTKAVQAGWTTGVLYGYSPNLLNPDRVGHYEFGGPGEGTLEPWKAYWVLVHEDVEVILYPGSGVGARQASVPSIGQGWQVQLVATTAESEDPWNFVGLALGAEEGYDVQDIAEPPAPGPGGVRLTLPHRDWPGRAAGEYARDVRPAGARRSEWEVEVVAPPGTPEVTLRWQGLPSVPPEYDLFLQDETAQRTLFLRTQAAYRFTPSPAGETRRFRLRAERRAGRTALAVVGLTVQRARGDSYAVSYTLSLPATVQMRVLSALTGHPVATVRPQARAAGMHTETWEGRDEAGRPLPNGAYLVEVTATTETGEMCRAVSGMALIR